MEGISSLLPKNINNERKTISYFISNSDKLYLINPEWYTDIDCKVLYYAIENIVDNKQSIDIDIIYDNIKNQTTISKTDIQMIYDEYTNFDNITHVIQTIKDNNVSIKIANDIDELGKSIISHGKLNKNKLSEISDNLNSKTFLLSSDSVLKNADELMDDYALILEERELGINKKSLGYKELDMIITRPAAAGEMTGLVGQKGSGKSIYAKCIENTLLNKNTCVLSINLEMEQNSTIDRLFCVRENISLEKLLHPEKSKRLFKKITNAIARFRKLKNYSYYPEAEIDTSTLDALIHQAKQKFKKDNVLPSDEYVFVVIDLLDMVTEFSGADPRVIKDGINRLHRIARKHMCHLLLILQANENKIRRMNISTPEKAEALQINMGDVEGAGAFSQRCRVMLSLNRPLLMKKHFFPERMDEWELETDFVNIHIIKQNDGDLGFKKFVFGDNFRIYPYLSSSKVVIEDNDAD